MNCTVLLFFTFVPLVVFLSKEQILEITGENIDYTDYGDEKLLWGKELSPQWCQSPTINSTLGDRVTLRSFFIEANSKGQSSVNLRCTLNSSGTGGVWLLIGSGGGVMNSFQPRCTYGKPTFHICELPHLIHRGLRINATRSSRFFRHNDTLIVNGNEVDDWIGTLNTLNPLNIPFRCALAQNTLHPPGKHTLRCINSQWVHEVNDVPSGLKYPNCATRNICAIWQIPHFLNFIPSSINCEGKPTSCFFPKASLPLGTKIELRCKDDTTRLVGPSSVVCLNSELHSGSNWYPSKWPNCIPKLTCPEPFIQKGDYITSDLSNATFRHGIQVWFKCWNGYILYGNEMVECLKSGLWNDSLPECIADKNGLNDDSITVLLFAVICCLSIILVIMFRAVYRQNRWLRRRDDSIAATTEEMFLRTMHCSMATDLRDASDTAY